MADLVAELTRDDAYPVFITGAGISVASGIPTFRGDDPNAIWKRDVVEKGTLRYFQNNPVESWKWYLDRFDGCRKAAPNPAHTAIADIEKQVLANGNKFLLVTQNVDGLHLAAGSQNLVEIHGAARKMRCTKKQCPHGAPRGFLEWDDSLFEAFRADPVFQNLPRCSECRSLIRAHVLWFDEYYDGHEDYGFQSIQHAAFEATCLVFVGTSFSVGITSMAVGAAADMDVPVFVIDPFMTEEHLKHLAVGETTTKAPMLTLLQERSEEYLPILAEEISR